MRFACLFSFGLFDCLVCGDFVLFLFMVYFEFSLNSKFLALQRTKHMVLQGEGIVNRENINLFLSCRKTGLTFEINSDTSQIKGIARETKSEVS